MLATDIDSDGIAVLRLDNEQRRNALSIAMRDAISDTLDEWATDDRVRVVVLTGTGTAFCAGFDLKEFAQPDLARTIRDSSHRYHLAVWEFPKPMIAAVNGAAFGGGFDLCLLCDMRMAVPSAMFAHPEIKFGAPPYSRRCRDRRRHRAICASPVGASFRRGHPAGSATPARRTQTAFWTKQRRPLK
jgi:enoyl-CoA hydratase